MGREHRRNGSLDPAGAGVVLRGRAKAFLRPGIIIGVGVTHNGELRGVVGVGWKL
jgi:hypothetical protein